MPTIPGDFGPYRLFFYSFDCDEPRHVHAERENKVCKFWLEPISLASNHRFKAKELNRIRRIISDDLDNIIACWDEHCGNE